MHSLKKGINVGLSETKMGFPQTGWETPSPISINSERKSCRYKNGWDKG
jgi:hypothetical protein